MMDPGQHPTTDDLRDFPRKQRNAPRREPAVEDEEPRGSEERYREFFNDAVDAYLITDVYGNIREANRAAGRLLGVDARSLAGKPLPSFFDDRARKEYRHQLDRICDFDQLDDWEIVLQPRGRERIPVSVSIARASAKQKTIGGYRWTLRDNAEFLSREHKAFERTESANRVKAEFLALLSHEFRTPLQAIFGYTELLERQIHGPLNEAQLRDLHRIQQSQQHLLGLIGTVLDFARLDSGQEVEVHLCPTLLDEILRNMEGFISSQLEKRNLRFRYDCSDATLAALTDPAKVQQIVLNLLANSLKFTPSGGQISLECESEREWVSISVIDSGIGIPGDKLEAVFEPYVQIANRETVCEGTGLGLSISRKLATAMGGTLTASSNLDMGSTFTLKLPLARS